MKIQENSRTVFPMHFKLSCNMSMLKKTKLTFWTSRILHTNLIITSVVTSTLKINLFLYDLESNELSMRITIVLVLPEFDRHPPMANRVQCEEFLHQFRMRLWNVRCKLENKNRCNKLKHPFKTEMSFTFGRTQYFALLYVCFWYFWYYSWPKPWLHYRKELSSLTSFADAGKSKIVPELPFWLS